MKKINEKIRFFLVGFIGVFISSIFALSVSFVFIAFMVLSFIFFNIFLALSINTAILPSVFSSFFWRGMENPGKKKSRVACFFFPRHRERVSSVDGLS